MADEETCEVGSTTAPSTMVCGYRFLKKQNFNVVILCIIWNKDTAAGCNERDLT
jgi:hypothetical protein